MKLEIFLVFAISWAIGAALALLGFFCIRGRNPRAAWLLIPAAAMGMGFAPSVIEGGHFVMIIPAPLAFFESLDGDGSRAALALSIRSVAAVTLVVWFSLLTIAAVRKRRLKRPV